MAVLMITGVRPGEGVDIHRGDSVFLIPAACCFADARREMKMWR